MPRQPTKFTLTDQHLTLLRHAWVGWNDCEFGAPEIDCKRPYGNSDVVGDICEILGLDRETEGTEELARRLHDETQTALQIILTSPSRELGYYVREPYNYRTWTRVK